MVNDLHWYLRRSEERNKTVINNVLEVMTKVLNLYCPFISEEIWEKMGKSGVVSVEKWPEADESKIDEKILKQEDAFKKTCEDIKHIIKLSKKKKNLYLYVVEDNEFKCLQQSISFLKREFGFKDVKVFKVSDPKKHDPENKSKRAKFGKPGIYIE